jgi:hypothetical protein
MKHITFRLLKVNTLIYDVFYMFLNLRVYLQEDGCMYKYGIICIYMHVNTYYTIPLFTYM